MTFGSGGCLSLGNTTTTIGMVSDTQAKYGSVTVIDDYFDPNSGMTNETRVNVGAVVPQIPPDWAYLLPINLPFPFPFFQGSLVTNPYNPPTNLYGLYNFIFSLADSGSNGLPVDTVVTQQVPVVNGLFNAPLPFDPSSFVANPLWLNIAVQPAGGNVPFTQLSSPLPLTPTPQAIYAYSAGVVASISPDQAVTSLDALMGDVQLQPGNGILIGTNGNVLTISTQPGVPSDRNLKTGFAAVQPEDILARVAALPIESWRYTNEISGIRHLGPMAQDFQAAFGLGSDGKMIYYVDENGVALAAIQGLNQKLNEKDAEIKELQAEVNQLKILVRPVAQPQTK
jgi:hypothetical protein